MEWISLLQTLAAGLLGGGVLSLLTRNGRRKAQADAFKMMEEAYEYRLASLQKSITASNEREVQESKRIAELNTALDGKTTQIRNLTEKVWIAEHEVNAVQEKLNKANSRIIALTEERNNYRQWHCRNADCENRIPPNRILRGKLFPGRRTAECGYTQGNLQIEMKEV